MNWVAFLLGMIVGACIVFGLTQFVLRKYEIYKKMPYRWICQKDNCNVRFGAQSIDLINQLADEHNDQYHGMDDD